jgi:sulfofructose kinase
MPVRLLAVGHVSLDHMFEVRALPGQPVKTPAQAYAMRVGGMGANAAVAAARLGAGVRFAGPVGDDDAATRFDDHLRREGVDTGALTRVPGASSSVSAVIVGAGGERLIVNHRGDALARAPAFDTAWVAGADIVITDPRCPRWAAAALAAAREQGRLTLLDADTSPREDLRPLVAQAAWAAFSEPGLAAFSDEPVETALAQALALGAEVALVTLGERGVVWRRRGQVAQALPAFAVDPVRDTTAAGDVFHGALAVALAESASDADALRFASAAAAIKCQRGGGVAGAPRRDEVERLLAHSSR